MATKRKPAKKAAGKTAAAKKAPAKKVKAAGKPLSERRRQPENLRLRSMSLGLTVNDVRKSLAWYRDILGFAAGEEWREDGALMGIEVRAGAVTLWLGQDDWKKGRDRVKGEGIRLYGRTAQDIDRLAALIKSRGGVLAHEPKTEPWGERDFGLVDPDGFKITITTGM
jgi:uncharacterized glyoxalase superfamily protein PhnB